MKRIIPIVLVLAAALAGVLYWQLRKQAAVLERPRGGSATIEGTEVGVVARIGARITAVNVHEGDKVAQGDLLVTLDCGDAEAALGQAEAQVELAKAAVGTAEAQAALARHGVDAAKAQAEAAAAAARANASQRGAVAVQQGAARRAAARVKSLAAAGTATEQELDRAQSEAEALGRQLVTLGAGANAAARQADAVSQGVKAAELQVALAEAAIESGKRQIVVAEAAKKRAELVVAECKLTAPHAGIVEVRAFEPGEVAVPGARLLTLVDIDTVRATFYLPNADLAAAAPGREVSVRADATPGKTWKGAVLRVATEAEFTPRNVQTREDRDRLVYAVEVEIGNADHALRPGMPVDIELAAEHVAADGQPGKAP